MWTEAQRRMLAAMGYTLYTRAGAEPISIAAAGVAEPVAEPVATRAAAKVSGDDDRLWQALRRAAAGRDIAALVDDLDALRRDPQRKRALWPRLRALRRH